MRISYSYLTSTDISCDIQDTHYNNTRKKCLVFIFLSTKPNLNWNEMGLGRTEYLHLI